MPALLTPLATRTNMSGKGNWGTFAAQISTRRGLGHRIEQQLRVGVKFCGGCNPYIDRVAVFEAIKAKASEVHFALSHNENIAGVLYVCGCQTACPLEDARADESGNVVIIGGETVDGVPVPANDIADLVLAKIGDWPSAR